MSALARHRAASKDATGALLASELTLSYAAPGGERHRVVDNVALEVDSGSAIGITGPSGSGKTSLLYLLSGIELPQAGRVVWSGTEVTTLSESARDRWRRRNVGLVFQDFHLVPGMSVMQNVLASCYFERTRVPALLRNRALALLERVGAPADRHSIGNLSRGEQQRVALARALLREPPILIADEPTASLDAANGRRVVDLLLDSVRDTGTTLIVVTHDALFLERLDKVYALQSGALSDWHA